MAITAKEKQEFIDQGYIHCFTIIEILGAPKEHVVDTLYEYVEQIKKKEDIKVAHADFAKPKAVGKLFTVFVELELFVKNASTLAYFCFDYMPSSIEIVEPETFRYNATDFSSFFNDLQARLHRVDKIAKELAAKNKNLLRNTNLLLRNNIIIILDNYGGLALTDMARRVGIPPSQLLPFLQEMTKEKWLKEEKGIYSLAKKAINPAPVQTGEQAQEESQPTHTVKGESS